MSTDDVTEADARTLLARAAATIEVDASAPMTLAGLPEPRLRRWPVLVAVAAVVLVVGGGFVVAQQVGTERADAPPPADSPLRPRDLDAVEQEVALDDDEVPGLIGYTQEEATALLEDRGLVVRVREKPDGCDVAGTVLGSTPAVGTRVQRGDTVTLRVVAARDVIDCVGEVPWADVWDLVRFARGLADPSRLAAPLWVQVAYGHPPVNDDPTTVLFSDKLLRNSAQWIVCAESDVCHSPLGALDQLTSQSWGAGSRGSTPSPTLRAAWASDRSICSAGAKGGRWDVRVWVEIPADGQFCPTTSIYLDLGEGGVAGVGLETVDPGSGDPLDATEPTPERAAAAAAAEAFVDWAQGKGPAPEFADRVRHFSPGFTPPWNDEPDGRDSWSGCSGLGFPDCGIDPVATVARTDEERVAIAAGRSTCPASGEVPERYDVAEADVIRLSEPEPADCADAWAVELWIIEDGEIYAVGLVAPGLS